MTPNTTADRGLAWPVAVAGAAALPDVGAGAGTGAAAAWAGADGAWAAGGFGADIPQV
nr:hypothetical protein GCM10017547_27600 [Pseudarthrobacter oxydans]